jgi:inner membrane protein
MTPYTHAFLGLGLGNVVTERRMPWLFWVLSGLLPITPDFDAFSLHRYGDMLGHRGWTHSLTFALVLGTATALVTFRYFKVKFWPLAGFFFLITASHGILDALTFGGFGIPFFWPFYNERFGSWGPVRVPDVSFEWPDPRRSQSIRGELMWVWLPTMILVVVVAAYRHIRRRAAPRPSKNQG